MKALMTQTSQFLTTLIFNMNFLSVLSLPPTYSPIHLAENWRGDMQFIPKSHNEHSDTLSITSLQWHKRKCRNLCDSAFKNTLKFSLHWLYFPGTMSLIEAASISIPKLRRHNKNTKLFRYVKGNFLRSCWKKWFLPLRPWRVVHLKKGAKAENIVHLQQWTTKTAIQLEYGMKQREHLVFAEEPLKAISALIRFNTRMAHAMTMHICLLTELHVTNIALIHLTLMTLVCLLKESFQTLDNSCSSDTSQRMSTMPTKFQGNT